MARFRVAVSTLFLTLLTFAVATTIPTTDYDVIVVGGGPAGLSALSGLSRVKRKTLLLDSGQYRNGPTRNMHDVIGNDGTVPSVFRALAREQISKYDTATMKNGTVTSITPINNGSYFRVIDDAQNNYTARRVVLGSGMKDILPNTPGIESAWGQGIFWCPWCDGYEHRNQSFGVLGPLRDVLSSVLEVRTLNTDVIAFVNGTYNAEEEAVLTQRYPDWAQQLAAYNVAINNSTITSIERLQNGSVVNDPAKDLQFDKFRVHFADNTSIVRSAFIANFPTDQFSTLPAQLNLTIQNKKVQVQSNMQTSLNGVFAVGDANSDGSTNVPHAMWSGKRAAVTIHVALAREESLAAISQRGLHSSKRQSEKETLRRMNDGFEELWARARLR